MFVNDHGFPRTSLFLAVLIASLTMIACMPERTSKQDVSVESNTGDRPVAVLAVYNGGTVTQDEYDGMLMRSGRRDRSEARMEFLEKIAVTEVMAEIALRDDAEQRISYQVSLRILDGKTMSDALRQHILDSITFTEDEIDAAVEEQWDLYRKPQLWRLKSIYKKFPLTPGSEESETKAQMERVLEELNQGAEFSEVAQSESDSQTRFRGGRLGLIDPGDLAPEIARAARLLRKGETSPIIHTPDGLVILHCDEIVEATTEDDESIRTMVEQRLRGIRFRKEWENLGIRLLEDVRIDTAALQETGDNESPVLVLQNGDEIGREMAAEFLRQGGQTHPLDEIPEDRLLELLEDIALHQSASSHAIELGLGQEPTVEATRVWGRLVTLAGEEIRARVQSRFQPHSEAEARAYFDQHKGGFQHPEQFQISAIVTYPEEIDIREAYRKSNLLVEETRNGRTSFENAAREYSQHPSAAGGGKLGWMSRWQLKKLGPILTEVVANLDRGHISDVVQERSPSGTGESLWIIRLDDVRAPRPLSYEEAVSQGMITELDSRRWSAILDEVWQEVLIEIEVRPVGIPAT